MACAHPSRIVIIQRDSLEGQPFDQSAHSPILRFNFQSESSETRGVQCLCKPVDWKNTQVVVRFPKILLHTKQQSMSQVHGFNDPALHYCETTESTVCTTFEH
ncbi:hypothetical protein GBA52_020307 [Prunus armeniaca]|nr:hypothetical protein GBA52_020307 [Prunus armeniaca]